MGKGEGDPENSRKRFEEPGVVGKIINNIKTLTGIQ
jgi:hypothetical protein